MQKILIVVLFTLISTLVFAEAEQIVYYDSERVLAENIDLQEANSTLTTEISGWEEEIAKLDNDIQKLTQEYEERRLTLLPSGQREVESQIEELKNQRTQKITEIYGENGEIFRRNNELISPIMEKLKNVIEKIAIENNYSLVLDSSTGAIGYAKPKLDITNDIIEEMEAIYESGDTENDTFKK